MKRIDSVKQSFLDLVPDRLFLYLFFYSSRHEILSLKNPKTYSAKIQWLKLHGNLERYARYADKYTVREYVKNTIGSEYLIPLIGVWDSFDEIPFDKLPNRFVLKATHGCGYNFICKDKASVDYATLRQTFNKWMTENFYKLQREPQYKDCTPRIVCEAYLEDETGSLTDYKFFCQKGNPEIIQVDADRFTNRKSDLLDIDWNRLDYVTVGTLNTPSKPIKKPENLKQMVSLARKLSKDFPFVRVDLYSVGNKIYFGELTFTPGSGIIELTPLSGDIKFGEMVDLEAYVPAT